MLGAYNVNGVPCELLVEQDALTWWPKSRTAATGGIDDGTTASASPLKQLRRLSNASSVIFNNISQLSGNGDDDNNNNDDKTSDIQQQQQQRGKKTSDRTRNKRRIELGQIVGLKPILHHQHKGDKKSAAGERPKRRAGQGLDQQSDSSESRTTISDESSQTSSQREQQLQPPTENQCEEEPPVSDRNFSKFKLYYVKRNDKKKGRLLKLKKISIGLSQSNPGRKPNQDRFDCENSTDDNTNERVDIGRKHRALVGLYEQIEQYLELVRRQRPKRLLVFVNPFGGKGRALHLYKSKVRKVLALAQVECELVVTKYANHARETIEDPQYDLSHLDGIVCVGGDGMFAELMNGLLFRCNRDKMLANSIRSLNGRLSDSLSCSDSTTTTDDNDTQQQQPSARNNHLQRRLRNDHRSRQTNHDTSHSLSSSTASSGDTNDSSSLTTTTEDSADVGRHRATGGVRPISEQQQQQIKFLRSSLGGIGEQFSTPSIPVGVIGAGSTDANLFGFIGTNDTLSATLNIVLGHQMQIDVCSVHSIQDDRLLRFVSTFVAYGYFGDVIRESEKLRWLGPSRYDVTALNSLIKYRHYEGLVRILRSSRDGTPLDLSRCHLNCRLCGQQQQDQSVACNNNNNNNNNNPFKIMPNSFSFDELTLTKLRRACQVDDVEPEVDPPAASAGGNCKESFAQQPLLLDDCDQFEIVEAQGPFVGVNAAVTACRCPQTRKGFSPGNHLANGCADLILVRPCSRMQYINYLIRTGYTNKSAFDLKYVDAYRCRQFEFIAQQRRSSRGGAQETPDRQQGSSWNADGEILREESLRVKVNNRLLRVFGTGEPQRGTNQKRANSKGKS